MKTKRWMLFSSLSIRNRKRSTISERPHAFPIHLGRAFIFQSEAILRKFLKRFAYKTVSETSNQQLYQDCKTTVEIPFNEVVLLKKVER